MISLLVAIIGPLLDDDPQPHRFAPRWQQAEGAKPLGLRAVRHTSFYIHNRRPFIREPVGSDRTSRSRANNGHIEIDGRPPGVGHWTAVSAATKAGTIRYRSPTSP